MSETPIQAAIQPDATLKSTPETVLWGYIAANLPPALSVKSGQIVEIEALSHQGLTTGKDPEKFFAGYGIPANEVLADAKQVYAEVKRPKGASVHILTGPIYVDGAEPGDTLEIRVHDIKFRVPYGVNNTGPGKGVLPKLLKEATAKLLRIDLERRVALFSDDIQIPLNPFMGIMAVSPPTSLGLVSSTPPGAWGGNIDLKYTGIGSSLFLPVFNKGGQFFTGDGHAVQGDGEVDGGAIEISLKPTLQFIVHKGKTIKQPRVETADGLSHHRARCRLKRRHQNRHAGSGGFPPRGERHERGGRLRAVEPCRGFRNWRSGRHRESGLCQDSQEYF